MSRCWNQNGGGYSISKGKTEPDSDDILVEESSYHNILILSTNTY